MNTKPTNTMTKFRGTIAASEVYITGGGKIIVPLRGLVKLNPHDWVDPEPVELGDCAAMALTMTMPRYARLFAGKYGEVEFEALDAEVADGHVNDEGFREVWTFHTVGDNPIKCPSLTDLATEFKTIEDAVTLLGGHDAMAKARMEEIAKVQVEATPPVADDVLA